tara:strand:+ start:47 stop:706 length:660 start_codon:yes stop_codon:yes gene_type:complete
MDYSNIAQPWAQPSGQAPRLPVRGNFPLFLKHHGKSWRFEYLTIKGKGKAKDKRIGVWLPDIQTEYERPGVNGIRTDGRSIDSSLRQANLNKDGYVVILPHQVDYLRVYPAQGGKYYTTKFFKLENVAGELMKSLDRAEWAQFRIKLILDGLVRPPHPTILERIRIQRARHIDRYVRQQHIPELAGKMKAIQDEVKGMSEAIAAFKEKGRDYYVELFKG